jgi:hypothetical protein
MGFPSLNLQDHMYGEREQDVKQTTTKPSIR